VYLDAVILIGYFERIDVGRHAREIISQTRKMIRNPEIVVKIPLIILGELAQKIFGKPEQNENFEKMDFLKLFCKLNPIFEGPSYESYNLAARLISEDDRLEPADALLVAQAVVDKTSEWLITTDSVLINNKVILDAINKRNSNLKISDDFRTHES